MKNSKQDNSEQLPHQDKKDPETIAEMDWFKRFENRPGIFDLYTINELKNLNLKMLNDLKKKINEID